MYEGTLAVRSSDLRNVQDNVTWHNAYALACQGRVEAVCNAGGRIRYFRLLTDRERPEMHVIPIVKECSGSSTAIAHTNLGVYREQVEGGVFSPNGGPHGEPGVEMVVIGHIYQFHLARL